MVTELHDSRAGHVTVLGTTITTHYTCTWEEWDNLDSNLPVIGNYWSIYRPDIRCTDITINQYAGNTYAEVVATWSSECREHPINRENQAASWEDSLDITMVESVVSAWKDTSDEWQTWETKWTDQGESYTADNKPDLIQYKSQMNYSVVAYGSASLIGRFADSVGRVNRTNFISQVQNIMMSVKTKTTDSAAFSDVGKLMFAGCRRTPVRATCYRYELQFIHDADGWNTQHGVTTNMYDTMDFMDLLAGMDMIEDDLNVGWHS